MKARKIHHGWVIVEAGGEGFKDHVSVEWTEGEDRFHEDVGRGESGCAKAVEWWDKKVGMSVKLEPTLRGAYRVYTEPLEFPPILKDLGLDPAAESYLDPDRER